MLGWRLGISAVLIPTLVGLFLWDARLGDSAPVLFVMCVLLTCRSAWELTRLLQHMAPDIDWRWPAVINTGLVLSVWAGRWSSQLAESGGPLVWLTAALSLAVLVLFLREAARFHQPGQAMVTLAAHLLIVLYSGFLLVMTAQLRWVDSFHPYTVLAALVIGVKMGDVGGYTFGRLFGKTKLIPRLSPGKTRAGGVGAVVTASVATWGWLAASAAWSDVTICAAWTLCFGAALGVIGLVGDLCESLIKRDMQQKDSADLFPGFGGLLDLLDSILYTGPAAWLIWIVSAQLGWI